ICGTLYDSNTTLDFCIWRSNGCTKFLLRLLRSRPIMILNKISFLCLKKEMIPIRDIFIRTLKGAPRYMLFKQAKEFVHTFLVSKRRECIISLLDNFQSHNIVFASATLDCLAFHIAQYFNISHFVSSKLLYNQQEICQGTLEIDLLGNKHTLFGDIYFVATDNLDDILLCQKAQSSVILTKKRNKKKWLSQNLKNSTIMEI
ncbi:hypothetical protein, partial [Helicobacter typhlonius]